MFQTDSIDVEDWYHGEIDRTEALTRLNTIGRDGTFLVRNSKGGSDNQPFTLVVLNKGHPYNLKVRTRTDGQLALGQEKSGELAFKDLASLIAHHRRNHVVLIKGDKRDKTLLTRFPAPP